MGGGRREITNFVIREIKKIAQITLMFGGGGREILSSL